MAVVIYARFTENHEKHQFKLIMVQDIDYLCLNEHELVRNLRLNAFGNFQKASNISAVFDNRLFIWKQEESCILTSQLGVYGDDPIENDYKSSFFQVIIQEVFKIAEN